MHILPIKYLEERAFCFTKVIEDNKEINKDDKKTETIFNSKKKQKKALYKEKKIV